MFSPDLSCRPMCSRCSRKPRTRYSVHTAGTSMAGGGAMARRSTPRGWSEVPRAEDCLQRADESAAVAARTTTWMERTWLKLAEEFEFLAQMDRAHHITSVHDCGSLAAPGSSHPD